MQQCKAVIKKRKKSDCETVVCNNKNHVATETRGMQSIQQRWTLRRVKGMRDISAVHDLEPDSARPHKCCLAVLEHVLWCSLRWSWRASVSTSLVLSPEASQRATPFWVSGTWSAYLHGNTTNISCLSGCSEVDLSLVCTVLVRSHSDVEFMTR